MQIRKYTAKDMQEAINLVKNDLGPEAVILTSHSVKGRRGRSLLEVTAAVDYDADAVMPGTESRRTLKQYIKPEGPPSYLAQDSQMAMHEKLMQIDKRLVDLESQTNLDIIYNQLDQLTKAVMSISKKVSVPAQTLGRIAYTGEEKQLFDRLIGAGVREHSAIDLMELVVSKLSMNNLETKQYGTDILARTVMEQVPLADLDRENRRICAVVGPTGMGKTTTLAKLAAEELFKFDRSIGFITVDTFRIGAIDQLKTYAKILKTPVEVAYDAADLVNKMKAMSHVDTIFIDTAGISPRDSKMMTELARYFSVDIQIETHLVLSAATQLSDLNEMADRFKIIPVDSVIITKIDEVTSFGNVYNFITSHRPPLSYFTTGQNVPDDLERATKERVADMLLGIS